MEFFSDYYQDLYIKFQGLVNKNNGLFKSKKHSNFVLKNTDTRNDAEYMKKHFGFDSLDTDHVVNVSAFYVFADYGSRSKIPVEIFFVLDEFGVKAKYKVGGNGNMRDGWAPNPKKCKLQWERPEDAELPVWEEVKPEEDTRPDLEEGRYKLSGVVKSTKVAFTDWGSSLKMLLELDNGNRVYGTVPSSIDEVDPGDRISLTGTVKRSDDDNHFGFYSRPSKATKG
jgi:hypothetical protein